MIQGISRYSFERIILIESAMKQKTKFKRNLSIISAIGLNLTGPYPSNPRSLAKKMLDYRASLESIRKHRCLRGGNPDGKRRQGKQEAWRAKREEEEANKGNATTVH